MTNAALTGKATHGLTPTATERAVAEMWKKILWLQEPVNVDDVFIDIGGNSLTATRCVNMIKAAFNVDVPLDLFFMDDGTVAVLAKLIDERATGEVRTTR